MEKEISNKLTSIEEYVSPMLELKRDIIYDICLMRFSLRFMVIVAAVSALPHPSFPNKLQNE